METTTTTTKTKYFSRPGLSLYFQFFNLSKGIVNAAITMIIYKPITAALKKSRLIEGILGNTNRKKFVLLSAISILALAVIVCVIIFILHGTFTFGKN